MCPGSTVGSDIGINVDRVIDDCRRGGLTSLSCGSNPSSTGACRLGVKCQGTIQMHWVKGDFRSSNAALHKLTRSWLCKTFHFKGRRALCILWRLLTATISCFFESRRCGEWKTHRWASMHRHL